MADNSDRDDKMTTGSTRPTRPIRVPMLSGAGEREPTGPRKRMAAGTDLLQLEPKDAYRVIVHYREPTYELRHGRKAEPYRWTFRVQARSNQDAVENAVTQFDVIARQSSVSWSREIVGVYVEREAADEPTGD